jgi:DNA-binding response OmpR family regulator
MENKKVRVLLAEDDKNLGAILKSYLEAKGFPATLCVNGQEAFIEFNKNDYDFCILDVMMPVKDGFTLAKEIRSIDKKVPILFLTAPGWKLFSAGATPKKKTAPMVIYTNLVKWNSIL